MASHGMITGFFKILKFKDFFFQIANTDFSLLNYCMYCFCNTDVVFCLTLFVFMACPHTECWESELYPSVRL